MALNIWEHYSTPLNVPPLSVLSEAVTAEAKAQFAFFKKSQYCIRRFCAIGSPKPSPLAVQRQNGSHSPRTIASICVAFLSRSWISRGCCCASLKLLMVLPLLSLCTSTAAFMLLLLSSQLLFWVVPVPWGGMPRGRSSGTAAG